MPYSRGSIQPQQGTNSKPCEPRDAKEKLLEHPQPESDNPSKTLVKHPRIETSHPIKTEPSKENANAPKGLSFGEQLMKLKKEKEVARKRASFEYCYPDFFEQNFPSKGLSFPVFQQYGLDDRLRRQYEKRIVEDPRGLLDIDGGREKVVSEKDLFKRNSKGTGVANPEDETA